MITPKILPAICLLLFSQINGQPKILNESFNNFNGAFRTQPKIPHSIQKQHNLITENQLTGKSSSIFWVEPKIRENYRPTAVSADERVSEDWCGTMPWWESRNSGQRSCDLYGVTDDPTVRDSYIPDENTDVKYIRLFIHAFADDNGNNPTITLADAEAQLLTLNEAFSDYIIQFVAWFQIHSDAQYQTITSAEWASGEIKEDYAMDPTVYHNVYVTDSHVDWGILGVSTFPWDSEALTVYGGTIVDKDWFGGPRTYNGQEDVPFNIITHELGHALGLWHTHHGVSEVTVCGSCYEGADGYTYATGDNADVVGDLCSDTKATPTNFTCADPDTFDCQNNNWINTDVHNFMGYAGDLCWNLNDDGFSNQQSGRVHGWITDKYEGLIVSSEEMTLLSVSFEDGTPADWTIVDNDADGNNWFVSVESAGFDLAHYGISGMVVLYNASGNDDWLITPVITVPQDAQSAALKFWARSYSSSFLEDFNVKLSTTGNSVNDFTVTLGSATDVSSSWTEYSYDISAYAGESIYLALQCVSVNEWYLFADDFLISASLNPLPLDADFIASSVSGDAPLSVVFTNLSTGNPTSWDWDFGDGNISTVQNPTHIYENPGLYTISLSISDGTDSHLETKSDYIEVDSPAAETLLSESFETELPSDWTVIDNDADGNQWLRYSDDAHDGSVSMGVQFNSSGNDDWLITPQLTFTENSSVSFSFWARSLSANWLEDFNVMLSTTGNTISDFTTTLESVTSTPISWTEYSYDLSAYSGQSFYLAVQCVSVDQFYLFVDDFEVTSDPVLLADFIASNTTGEAPLITQFTNQSWGNPTSWSWSFGDGGSSTVQNPLYTFQTPGIYDVSLIISNSTENDTITMSDYVIVTAPDFSGPVFHVSTSGSDVIGNGTEDYPFATIQSAINAAGSDDTVSVADGVYTGVGNKELTWDGTEKHITVTSVNGPDNCIIDLEGNGRAFTFISGLGDDAIWITPDDVIKGFTISNGNSADYGGAIYCYYGYENDVSPTIQNCIFSNNTALYGGALYISGGSSLVENCIFNGNSANFGGAVWSSLAGGPTNPKFVDCTFTNNIAFATASPVQEGEGGAFCIVNIDPESVDASPDFEIIKCIFDGNNALRGGAIYFSTSELEVKESLFYNNVAEHNGSAIYVFNYRGPRIYNCTIADNVGPEAVYNYGFNGTVEPVFVNTIIRDDSSAFAFDDISQANPTISYCNLEGGFPITGTDGGGNIDADPRFVDTANGDYHLADWSPCIGTGLDTSIVSSTDIEGNPRPNPAGS
ncbi:MAG: choice-of-anchor J domain-containing protein, partial [Candidatus Marinimicrobia bacterium]|nr:choice-of-anchor J domain-containing protein [Candidatus Neomarinimicrobiota bacterium]